MHPDILRMRVWLAAKLPAQAFQIEGGWWDNSEQALAWLEGVQAERARVVDIVSTVIALCSTKSWDDCAKNILKSIQDIQP